MEEPKPQKPIDLSEVDSLSNIDTARMALRWALERIHAVEKLKEDVARKLDETSIALRETREEFKTLQNAMGAALKEANQRESYYAKVEELLSQKLAGKLDIAALVKHEADVKQL